MSLPMKVLSSSVTVVDDMEDRGVRMGCIEIKETYADRHPLYLSKLQPLK